MPNAWSFLGRWQRLRRYLQRWRRALTSPISAVEPPLRSQLFGAEQMARHGESLARMHRVHTRKTPDQLLARLDKNEKVLDDARVQLSSMAAEGVQITPAGEWLLDNFYLIEEQIRTARLHLPKGYSRQLPTLEDGPATGMPRVLHLAMEAIAHGDGRVDAETVSRFVAAYQSVTPLKLGELWAIPIMLRLALIENLRRIALRVMRGSADQKLAAEWAARLNETAEREPKSLVLVLADMVRSSLPRSESFVAELMRRLHGGPAALTMPRHWLEQCVTHDGFSVDQLVNADGQQQAAEQVSVGNSIGSLRSLANMDWREFVEDLSVVEQILRDDPAVIHGRMDFETRDSYRHVVEQLARLSGVDEPDVARLALTLARAGTPHPALARAVETHIGYYLVDDGLPQLKAAIVAAGSKRRWLLLRPRRVSLPAYQLPIALVLVFFVTMLLLEMQHPAPPWAPLWLIVMLAIIVFSELSIILVNWVATLLVAPRRLPRLDFSLGIPADARTLVAVPSMLGSKDAIDALVATLEVHFLANRDPHLHFALLTDFNDAAQQTLPADEALLSHAAELIDALNDRYAGEDKDRFFLLPRPRQWNASEGKWMGSERKRGKLAALNHLLQDRDGSLDAFMLTVGNLDALPGLRYVITLDTDTQLPLDAAREFVATLAHPLNKAYFDERLGRVVRGYGILQPSVGASMSGRQASRYAHMYGTEPGIDPYTRLVSNVYQDLFGEGSFVGKGIYDIEAFERALHGRFPDNSILSHDLLEGCYARAGLISDVRLYEDYPSRYAADAKRRERWIRGDWQLLPWLLPWVPLKKSVANEQAKPTTRERRWESNPLTFLSRGKIIDNLRRSLVPASAVALFVIGWLLLADPLMWTVWLACLLLLPVLVPAIRDLAEKPSDMTMETHLLQVGQGLWRGLQRVLVNLACLPYEAWLSLGAIMRTLWRMVVTRRHMLQWNPSSEVERNLSRSMNAELRMMWFAPAFAITIIVLLCKVNQAALPVALPILLLWMLSPPLMAWLGRAPQQRAAALSSPQLAFLRVLARRTWAFFEVNVRAEDHWLPPDNLQEHPSPKLARRTSPTNIGLSLLANLAAHDFGYLTTAQLVKRCADTLTTLEKLPRHRGHLFNWYDTETLEPLPPRYVSTVDSGNLAGHLLILRQGLLALIDAPVLEISNTLEGISDTFAVLEQTHADAVGGGRRDTDADLRQALKNFQHRLEATRAMPPASLHAAAQAFDALAEDAAAVELACTQQFESPLVLANSHWPQALSAACRAACAEAHHFSSSAASSAELGENTTALIPSLRMLQVTTDTVMLEYARARIEELERIAHIAGQCAQMEWEFLYHRARHLLSIGYNVDEHRLDAGYYDLLASEARLGNFVAIAQGQLPQESWFALGRLLTEVDGEATLLSWSGSMFEYLMPGLVMPSYPDTLLGHTEQHAVRAQIRYGARRGVPWGISESGYNSVDARMNYQYRAFGVPGLGLKRGLGQDLVIAPYASMMALIVAPRASCLNLQRMADSGFAGQFGFFEAIDYTPARLPPGQKQAVVRSYMAHHQGMGLLALVHLLREQPMQHRFVADPEFRAALLLLQERVPRAGVFHPHEAESQNAPAVDASDEAQLRIFINPSLSQPAVQLLSNGVYHALLSSAGGGYSKMRDMAITRWREDNTCDNHGSFCYLRDVSSGDFWSAALQPTCVPVEHYEAIFSDAKAEYRGRHRGYETHMEIAVSAEDDIELRRLRISNRSSRTRTIEITTYAEVVLAPGISDELHPAFSNLFVQTQILREKQALLCTRRPRSHDEVPPWMLHVMSVHDAKIDSISYETDRTRFLGRGNTPRAPQALTSLERLSDSDGSVLDPIVAIRVRMTLAPYQKAVIDMVTGVGAQRDACVALIDKYRDRHLADRVFDLAWTHSEVIRRQINATQSDARLFERLAGSLVYAHSFLRAAPQVLLQNRRGQSGLWGHAISGDLPIVLLQIGEAANFNLVQQLVQAHAYWRLKGLHVDLLIWNEEQGGYRQDLHDQILSLITSGSEAHLIDRPGGIFVRAAHQITQEDRILLESVARVVLSDANGTLAAQLGQRAKQERVVPLLLAYETQPPLRAPTWTPPLGVEPGLPSLISPSAEDLWPFDAVAQEFVFDNSIGAFSADGREYIIVSREGAPTPAPWCNVLANAQLGTVVSESSAGYTWFENAHEFRLTPWHNDPIADACGEAFYLRDEDTGYVWSPTPLPCRGLGAYRTRHGFGYSVWEHVEDGIASELWVFVDLDDAVKFSRLVLRNLSGRARRLSATGYVEWVMGDLRTRTRMHVATDVDKATGAIVARNPYNTEFEGRVAYFDVDAENRTITGDRAEFLGRNGHMGAPEAMRYAYLSGRTGVGLDPCAAIQVPVSLAPMEVFETTFRLGAASNHDAAMMLAKRTKGAAAALAALTAVRKHWSVTLGGLQVKTPEPSVDLLINGWLPYQTLACRYLARSGYYQSGGAFGFRDQLQDMMATVHLAPALSREHLLRSAAQQFPQGDVLHWWHPPQGRGVRTRCSDDYLWLPLAVCRYLDVTADQAVLEERVQFVEGRALNVGEESWYDLPVASGHSQSLYQHCELALRRGVELLGERGLPLIGGGDWNDGMSRVGIEGRGESVWLAFFLFDTLTRFSEVARTRGDDELAVWCLASAAALRENIDKHGWDGNWYRRAWFDDGTPLGSSSSGDCMIDSISQSWSVLSGAANNARARQAMDSLDKHLVRRDAGLIQLLDPPFDATDIDPGYIRGYVPGVRENGGQYTHAAVWAAMAFAELGDIERAWELARMINPIHHAEDAEGANRYKVEPYVLAADVYAVPPHTGRGGWTWYTGSAAWMYRLLTESLLGLRRHGDMLEISPRIPTEWPHYRLQYCYGNSVYIIEIHQHDGADATLQLDGISQSALQFRLVDDASTHRVDIQWPRKHS